jgi:hypothetical protein
MRTRTLVWLPVMWLFASAAFGQISQDSFFPHKDLLFPQVAAGGQYETWITVTNRGTQSWVGTFNFYSGDKVAWNPYVNNIPMSGGSLAVTIAAKKTRTFKVTLPGNTEAGYMKATTTNRTLDNYLEGNLTYFIGDGEAIADSIGILPSNPVLATVLPFEDFSSLCFAFVNADTQGRTATLTIALYSDENVQVGSSATIPLLPGAYTAQYMWQTFPSVPDDAWRGRIEIQSDVPVSGVALMQATGGQLSSLPLDSTTRSYSLQTSSAYVPFGALTFWTNGLFLNGYMTGSSGEIYGLLGQIDSDNSIELHYRGVSPVLGVESFGFFKSSGAYRPGQSTITGTFQTYIPALSSYKTGTFTATLVP